MSLQGKMLITAQGGTFPPLQFDDSENATQKLQRRGLLVGSSRGAVMATFEGTLLPGCGFV